MANKRDLKKRVEEVCLDLANECFFAIRFIDGADRSKLIEAVKRLALLQGRTLSRIGVAFDRRPKDFASLREYHKARRAYYKEAYKSLAEGFNKEIAEIINVMNSSLPKRDK